ncbi:arrestin domain-containing protein 1-like [Neolamprologus brichardi]|uniref:arrestin domain-containing protein 1-like n=1 Tax=Neolamprologus brichardi TaxID=32507 RepID=UPI0003EBB7F8|nr:arrestin domain-containing protein 1-like [Neolamprologus brichardi]
MPSLRQRAVMPWCSGPPPEPEIDGEPEVDYRRLRERLQRGVSCKLHSHWQGSAEVVERPAEVVYRIHMLGPRAIKFWELIYDEDTEAVSAAATAPTSFEGNYGRIIYRVRAFIDTPRFSKDYTTEKAFFLLSLLNLNEVPDIWGTCSSAVTQQFNYMLMKTGIIVLRAQTHMKGYTPGEVIQVTANIHNQSGKSTGNMAASLIQRITYETKKPTHDVRIIAAVEGGVVKAGKEVEWKEQIIVPPLPQSSLAGCELIKIEYFVKVCLKSPDVLLTLPIHIGNVALDKKHRPSKKASAPSTEDTPASDSTLDTSISASSPTLPPRPAPKPAPRLAPPSRGSSRNSPSAPPADYHPGAEGGALMNEDSQNKRQSQLVSPNAFSYAPGLFFPQNQQPVGPATAPNGPEFSGTTSLYPSLNGTTSVATPQILPPDYSTSDYPKEAPPSYNASCNT